VQGVTYGTFRPDADGRRFPDRNRVERDFAAMAAHGINAVRTYTEPPVWLLDAAACSGLWVMAGLPWEQHIAFLSERRQRRTIERKVGELAASCAGHPALLCYAVGNEIPTPIVRWHGRAKVERFLERLCTRVRREDPDGLVTYVNYPSTEYLRLPFVDLLAFNVYLDDAASVARYLGRLQNLADDKPLLVAEMGIDSLRQGADTQASGLASQIDVAFSLGCAGTFVFSWTDEWHRGDDDVLDWDFGLTDRCRRPKPALTAVSQAYGAAGTGASWPAASVIVCTFNGGATLDACLQGVAELRYSNYQVIVVDDGSTDDTAEIAAGYDVQLIRTPNQGLSAARNTGLAAATGDIVAYIDDDAVPDPDWLRFLAIGFRDSDHAAVGGPNVPPHDAGAVATCVENAPGGPVHVLISDLEAEHIPGCNMAYRRSELLAIGGFDPQFRAAGDDVDVCWRLQEAGATLGFHPAALVWHRRRDSVRRYWRQQQGYGKAEALLERKWPERYNRRGHVTWSGRLYNRASRIRPARIYHGTWGTGAFQPDEGERPGPLAELARTPEWYMVLGGLAGLSVLGLVWHAMLVMIPLLVAAVSIPVAEATRVAAGAHLGRHADHRLRATGMRLLTACLYLAQPAARLTGRLSLGLAPWRQSRTRGLAVPRRLMRTAWFERWIGGGDRVALIEASARADGARVLRGGPYDRWDLEVSGGPAGGVRMLVAVEEHGRGRQLMRCRMWPVVPRPVVYTGAALALIAASAARAGQWVPAFVCGWLFLGIATLAAWECAIAMAAALAGFRGSGSARADDRVRRSMTRWDPRAVEET
jgi:O-antigen biosynthesis protein